MTSFILMSDSQFSNYLFEINYLIIVMFNLLYSIHNIHQHTTLKVLQLTVNSLLSFIYSHFDSNDFIISVSCVSINSSIYSIFSPQFLFSNDSVNFISIFFILVLLNLFIPVCFVYTQMIHFKQIPQSFMHVYIQCEYIDLFTLPTHTFQCFSVDE